MARTTPVHSGYTIINGSGTGPNGDRIDVWVEYEIGTGDVATNKTPFTAYFYAALNPDHSSSTSSVNGLNSSFEVDGVAGNAVSNGAYDFRSPDTVNLLGSYSGKIAHDSKGEKTVSIVGSFTTLSSYISGGNISAAVKLPVIHRGFVQIDTGTEMKQAIPYIDTGTEWKQAVAYIDTGTEWAICG